MSDTLRGNFFNATRDMFGDNSVRYMNIELALMSTNYDDSGYGFDWGNKDKGSKLLASAILTKIGTPTVARIYTDKYTDSVIQKLTQDNWSLEAIEVARWINNNTDYTIEIIDENGEIQKKELKLKREKELEEKAKEERKEEREKMFQQKIQTKLKEKEAKAKIEEAKANEEESENFQNTINNYKVKISKYQGDCCNSSIIFVTFSFRGILYLLSVYGIKIITI